MGLQDLRIQKFFLTTKYLNTVTEMSKEVGNSNRQYLEASGDGHIGRLRCLNFL